MTTEHKQVARCAIYDSRPQVCIDYPRVDHFTPGECTYTFVGGERRGECACDEGACCAVPRVGGEPGGAPMPEVAGGEACKHLVWNEEERPVEKTASAGHVALPVVQPSADIYNMVNGSHDS